MKQGEVVRKGPRGGLRREEPGGEIRSWLRLQSWPVGLNQTRSHSVGQVRRAATRKGDKRIRKGVLGTGHHSKWNAHWSAKTAR